MEKAVVYVANGQVFEVNEYTGKFMEWSDSCGMLVDDIGGPPSKEMNCGIYIFEGVAIRVESDWPGAYESELNGTFRELTEEEQKRLAYGRFVFEENVNKNGETK